MVWVAFQFIVTLYSWALMLVCLYCDIKIHYKNIFRFVESSLLPKKEKILSK